MNKPKWLIEAEKFIGTKEIKGSQHNPTTVQFWGNSKLSGIKNDEIAYN